MGYLVHRDGVSASSDTWDRYSSHETNSVTGENDSSRNYYVNLPVLIDFDVSTYSSEPDTNTFIFLRSFFHRYNNPRPVTFDITVINVAS